MKLIPLSAAKKCKWAGHFVAIVDDIDGDLAKLAWHARVSSGGRNRLVYAMRQVPGESRHLRMHRVIWERANGPIPDGFEVDHIAHGDNGGLDNRRSNLRLLPHALNVANARLKVNNVSGFKGVHLCKRTGRWQALIRVDGKRRHLGYFDSAEQGGAAYDCAARSAWGASANTNDDIRSRNLNA